MFILDFIKELIDRNETLFYFGLICFLLSLTFFCLAIVFPIKVSGARAWVKPFKFALSIALYSFTMAWFVYYLKDFNTKLFNWTVIILLGFEIIYIAIQAGRGQKSHFNLSTTLYSVLYFLMGAAATIVTIYTSYIGILFFQTDLPSLPVYYLWSIRFGIALFVIFSFEGFLMGSRLSHTIGGEDGGPGIKILNWSKKFGDPRIAHFIGMHALQILPILSFYVFKDLSVTILFAFLYATLAVFTLIQALRSKPFHKL